MTDTLAEKYTVDEYIERIIAFHGTLAPGLLIGGYMVDHALCNRPGGEFFDALCETSVCLPDAVQLLTPCTFGNGWLKICDVGRFALTFFEKYSGEGVRVHLDAAGLDAYPEIQNWFLRLKPKHDQDMERLIREIRTAQAGILGMKRVRVHERFVGKEKGGRIVLCPSCGEAYPERDGPRCRACGGTALYI